MIDISFLLGDPDFTTSFMLTERNTKFVDGEYIAEEAVTTTLYGTVRPTSEKDLEMLPEGDRISGTTTFFVKGRIVLDINERLAPLLKYKGNTYKAITVIDMSDSGYTKIIAVLQGRGG